MNSKYKGDNMIFIVGCPRSGTTWIQRLLASHPCTRTGQESNLFNVYLGPQLRGWRWSKKPKNWSGRGGVGLACYFQEVEFLDILQDYMLRLMEPMIELLQPGEVFLEKTPSHALYIPEIVELLPKSRVIHILRDARDVVASLLFASRSWGKTWAPRDARAATEMWVRHVRAVREAEPELSKAQFLEVRYEDLYANPHNVLSKVSQFLDLRWDKNEIREAVEHNNPRVVRKRGGTSIPIGGEVAKTLGASVREPEGFIRRGCPGGWQKDLTWVEKFWVWRTARKTMLEFGYQWDFPW